MTGEHAPTILCMASMEKGHDFMRECKRRGWRVLLVSVNELEHAGWPRESIDETFFMPDLYNVQHVINGVSYLARTRLIDRIVALHDLDFEAAAALREHMQLPGLSSSRARYFRDKLAMRVRAREAGLPVPDFVHILHHHTVWEYMQRVPPPWLLKPRYEAGSLGIKRIEAEHELWPILEQLGDAQSNHLLERFLPGDLYHVDSIVSGGKVVFAEAHAYGRPLLEIVHHGGLFTTRSLPAKSKDGKALRKLNEQALKAMELTDGVSHTEFIKDETGQLAFLETSARVGGANIAELVEVATGISLWREWAKLETRAPGESYKPPEHRQNAAGMITSLARQEWPDTSAYDDPEIVWRLTMPHHAGLIVVSPDDQRVEALLSGYGTRFEHDFFHALPPQTESAHDLH
jgi:biotin carboxylase